MKNLIFIPIVLLLITGCNQAELDKALQKNDSLTSVVTERDSSFNKFITSFNEIEANLDSIAAKQQIISINSHRGTSDLRNKKAHINAEIGAINNLMERNRRELEDLKRKWKVSKNRNALLEKTIKTLTAQLSQKDYELGELNQKLSAMDNKVTQLVTKVDSLDQENYLQSIVINYQTKDLHTAYYIVGETKELRDQKIIDRKGGVLGIGRTSKLNDSIDKSKFTKIDFTQTTTIPINGGGVKIITSHPADSYHLDKDETNADLVKNVVITNPEKFWNTSKYLVIVKK